MKGPRMRIRKFIPPMSIVLFLVLVLVGTYYVRLCILERHMVAAMEMEDEEMICLLVDSWPCPVNAWDKDGRTALHLAAYQGDRALAELLLRKRADVNAKDYRDDTPLHSAAWEGRRETAEFLIARGADVNAKDTIGWTPLHYAAQRGFNETVELLIAKGADINAKDHVYGWTPLHLAAEWTERTAIVDLLIAKGTDLTARDHKGRTPLGVAIDYHCDASAELLRKAGAKE